jgi:hypothetical protein
LHGYRRNQQRSDQATCHVPTYLWSRPRLRFDFPEKARAHNCKVAIVESHHGFSKPPGTGANALHAHIWRSIRANSWVDYSYTITVRIDVPG